MQWSLLFDNDCVICVSLANYLRKFNRNDNLQIISLQSIEAKNTNLTNLKQEIHLINQNGDSLDGDEAIEKLIEIMPQSKPMRWLIQKSFGSKVAVPVYRLMNSIRRHCSKCTCGKH